MGVGGAAKSVFIESGVPASALCASRVSDVTGGSVESSTGSYYIWNTAGSISSDYQGSSEQSNCQMQLVDL